MARTKLDESRETRFPPSGPRDVRSHMSNLRELEDAIILLQQQVATLQAQVTALQNA